MTNAIRSGLWLVEAKSDEYKKGFYEDVKYVMKFKYLDLEHIMYFDKDITFRGHDTIEIVKNGYILVDVIANQDLYNKAVKEVYRIISRWSSKE